jgi:hypothetical protein
VLGGSGLIELDGKPLGEKGGRSTMESPGWGTATDRYDVEVVGGSKSIEVVGRPA